MSGIYSKDFAPKLYIISRQLRRKIWLIFGRRLESETYVSSPTGWENSSRTTRRLLRY